MCDALVALPDATKNGTVVFGKNSDRPIDDCQVLYVSPGGSRQPTSNIQCSYVQVPEASSVLATIGCRPYWCWGYETGMNEAGVVAGNTAIFTRALWIDRGEQPLGLTGMDLLRLGLERGRTAEEAVQVIAELLERYGQWGSGVPGVDHESGSYDNAFLIADRKEAWVLETSGRRWIAERVTGGIRTLSNQPTIRTRWTAASNDIQQFASDMGWRSADGGPFDFALAYGDHEHYARQVSQIRWKRTGQLLRESLGQIEISTMMRILRDHYEDTFLGGPQFNRFLPDFHTVCMHNSPAGFTWGNTATSVVVELDANTPAPPAFWTCYQPPCCSIYSAFPLGQPLPDTVTQTGTAGLTVRPACDAPRDEPVESSLWWRQRRLVDAIARQPHERPDQLRHRVDPLEQARLLNAASRPDRLADMVGEQIDEVTAALSEFERNWQLPPFE